MRTNASRLLIWLSIKRNSFKEASVLDLTLVSKLLVFAIFFSMITLYNKLPLSETKNRVLVMGMIAATTTYFVHAFLNNFLDTDKAAVPIWAMCAMVIVMGMQLNSKENTVISK
jgi:hypothetical protein